jgi:hypothetical protein
MRAVKIEVRCSNYERKTTYKSTSSQRFRKIVHGFSRPFNPFSEPRWCLVAENVCYKFLGVRVKFLVELGAITFCPCTFPSFSVNSEMLKYGGNLLVLEITKLIQQILISYKIPEDRKPSIAVPIVEMGNRLLPENYRTIKLPCTLLKV